MELELPESVASPVCLATLRVHAFQPFRSVEARCRDCGLVMPAHAIFRDGPDARHCLSCGWWSGEEDSGAGGYCVWCKEPFDD